MRKIKFRGKQRGWKQDWTWYYGNLYCKDGYGRTHIRDINHGCYDIDPETVGQFTGVRDINGKEIYEGDRVNAHWFYFDGKGEAEEKIENAVIEEKSGCFGFYWKKYGNFISLCEINWDEDIIEVVGNIYDNPELLKGGEE